MSFFSKLNPLNWIKDILVSDYVGGFLRHVVTFIGSYLATKGLGDVQYINDWTEATVKLLTDPQFVTGVVAIVSSYGASIANKKTE